MTRIILWNVSQSSKFMKSWSSIHNTNSQNFQLLNNSIDSTLNIREWTNSLSDKEMISWWGGSTTLTRIPRAQSIKNTFEIKVEKFQKLDFHPKVNILLSVWKKEPCYMEAKISNLKDFTPKNLQLILNFLQTKDIW